MTDGKMVKVLGWYDNEWGYSNRLIDLVAFVAEMDLPRLEDLPEKGSAATLPPARFPRLPAGAPAPGGRARVRLDAGREFPARLRPIAGTVRPGAGQTPPTRGDLPRFPVLLGVLTAT